MDMYKSADDYVENVSTFKEEIEALRKILNSTELEEGVKWGIPAYLLDGKNLIGLAAFKSYCGLWFHQGALLEDKHNKLMNAQEGVTKAMRQWRFSSTAEIDAPLIIAYVEETIANHRAGKEIKPAKKKPLVLPDELKEAFAQNPDASVAFDEMKPTYQREFAEYIEKAKRPETKQKRLTKIMPMILKGTGLNDQYR